jgi:nitrate reductase NapAB chaperone NapD
MNVTSIIVEIEPGTSEAVLRSLALIDKVTVYGVKDEKIVVVLEEETPDAIEELAKKVEAIEHISGLSPVFSVSE